MFSGVATQRFVSKKISHIYSHPIFVRILSSKGVTINLAQLEKRIAALEIEVARLKANQVGGSGPINNKEWLEEIRGSFANDPAFDEAMRYGREWREAENRKSLRTPKTSPSKKVRKPRK